MNRLLKIITSLALITMVAKADAQSDIEDLQGKISNAKSSLNLTEDEMRRVLGELYKIKKQMKSIEKERGRVGSKKSGLENNIKSVEQIIKNLNTKVSLQRDTVKKRVRALYKFGVRGVFKTVFGSSTSSLMDRNLRILKQITEHDYRLLSNYRVNAKILAQQRKNLLAKQNKIQSLTENLKHLEVSLNQQLHLKNGMLENLEVKRALDLAQFQKAKLKTKKLADKDSAKMRLLSELLETSFFERKGNLKWPVEGSIIRPYGIFKVEGETLEFKNKGMLIQSHQKEASVVVPFDGIVEFIGEVEGYGLTVIVNHGDRYRSVYSNLENSKTSKGSKIHEGESIGAVKELNGQSILHFELRHYSDAINPEEWLDKKYGEPI